MENRDHLTEKFIKEYEALTDEKKRAVCWFIENMEVVKKLSEGEKISKNKMKSLIEEAKINEDYYMLLLLLYIQQADQIAL